MTDGNNLDIPAILHRNDNTNHFITIVKVYADGNHIYYKHGSKNNPTEGTVHWALAEEIDYTLIDLKELECI